MSVISGLRRLSGNGFVHSGPGRSRAGLSVRPDYRLRTIGTALWARHYGHGTALPAWPMCRRSGGGPAARDNVSVMRTVHGTGAAPVGPSPTRSGGLRRHVVLGCAGSAGSRALRLLDRHPEALTVSGPAARGSRQAEAPDQMAWFPDAVSAFTSGSLPFPGIIDVLSAILDEAGGMSEDPGSGSRERQAGAGHRGMGQGQGRSNSRQHGGSSALDGQQSYAGSTVTRTGRSRQRDRGPGQGRGKVEAAR